MPDNRSISLRLLDAGYTHQAVRGHGPGRHIIIRRSDGWVEGFRNAAECCDLLNVPMAERLMLAPWLVGFGAEE